MNETVNKIFLNEDKFMQKLHLKQPGFFYGACKPFFKLLETIQKLKKQVV